MTRSPFAAQGNGTARNEIEIMSPAGNFECLVAAMQGGANAIYFGAGKLNMRSRSANNFSIADLPEIAERCGEKHIKTYLAANTVMFDEDLAEMRELIDAAKDAGITAVIAADPATIVRAREKGVEVHLSTQVNVTNFEALRFYAPYADVLVPARELTLEQVSEIHAGIIRSNLRGPGGQHIRIEMFAHGALCMAVSGKCYLSLHEYGASANRGSCYQVCRRSYRATDTETGRELELDSPYIMSPKDLCTIDFMDKMIAAGVRIFKIEGRARSAEYVKTATRCYSEAASAVADGSYAPERIAKWKDTLATVFNRGFWDGYYLGRKLGELSESHGSQATKRKTYLGRITNYYSNAGVAEILTEAGELKLKDEILIIGPTTGAVEHAVEEIRTDDKPVSRSAKGEYCSVRLNEKVRRGDKVFLVGG
ncbi:MAG: U32 family peptidase [Prevotellaceae bacterium]|jgi:putative protease|nr:U32 family peptidase [Prevotellaceae bacterium]